MEKQQKTTRLTPGAARNASVVAEEITELFILQRYYFDKILMKNPVIAEELKKSYQERKDKNK